MDPYVTDFELFMNYFQHAINAMNNRKITIHLSTALIKEAQQTGILHIPFNGSVHECKTILEHYVGRLGVVHHTDIISGEIIVLIILTKLLQHQVQDDVEPPPSDVVHYV